MKDKSDTKPPAKDINKERISVPVDKSKAFEAVDSSEPIKDKTGKLKEE
jgi:hypothetical protein|tara:strand:+ start:610 stop:756 length:147 start_codon:yes stop_codon:yes gene_type:complete